MIKKIAIFAAAVLLGGTALSKSASAGGASVQRTGDSAPAAAIVVSPLMPGGTDIDEAQLAKNQTEIARVAEAIRQRGGAALSGLAVDPRRLEIWSWWQPSAPEVVRHLDTGNIVVHFATARYERSKLVGARQTVFGLLNVRESAAVYSVSIAADGSGLIVGGSQTLDHDRLCAVVAVTSVACRDISVVVEPGSVSYPTQLSAVA